ncbi:MAG: efflux RND transporter periplasmic adaptor subunit [Methylococcaceae bacterium]|nr:efflux RND transporter periplasmic adaptor subunit [Methylococcaceae bacterium]
MKLSKALLFIGLAMFFGATLQAEESIQLSQEHFNNLGVTLGKLERVNQIPLLYAPAKVTIPPTHEYIVSASQAGLVTRLNAAVGDKVKKGDVMAQINSSDLLSMQRLYLKARSELAIGQLAYQRDKKLLESGVIPERRWQETQSQYNAFLSEADEHRQLLEIAGMSASDINHLGKTHKLSGQLNIYAPVTGIVIERMAVAGERVDNLAPIYRMGILDELWLEIAIPQERLGTIRQGDKVLVENSLVKAEISLLGQSVNLENQSVLARAIVKNAQSTIRPGQKINIQIIHETDNGFKVPNVAIAQNEGKSFIFIRTPTGFQISPITVLGKQGDESIIGGDLTGDEEIAVKGAVALKANWLGLGGSE